MKTTCKIALSLFSFLFPPALFAGGDTTLRCIKTISGNISPKSVVASANGMVYAQNMMYKHTITVYDKNGNLVHTLIDTVHPAAYGIRDSADVLRGGPVEAGVTSDGNNLFVSNYSMVGKGYNKPGCDHCLGRNTYDHSYLYRFDTRNHKKTACIPTGAVPKFLAVSPDDKYVALSNWSEGTVAVYRISDNKKIKEAFVGAYPRGLTFSSDSKHLYVAVMGSSYITEFRFPAMKMVRKIEVGKNPRHICGPVGDSVLFVSLNGEGSVARVSLLTGKTQKLYTGSMPRSMALSSDKSFLYVVNYGDATFSKIQTDKFEKTENAETRKDPIGITVNPVTGEIWVACYSGFIQVFGDSDYDAVPKENHLSRVDWGLPLNSIYKAFHAYLSGPLETPGKTESHLKSEKSSGKEINSSPTTGYYVIAGAFRSSQNAHRLQNKLVEVYSDVRLIPKKEDKSMIYVGIGPFGSKEEAQKSSESAFAESGENYWIYRY